MLARRRLIGKGGGRDEVLATDLLGRATELRGDHVHEPLEIVRGLRPAGAAVGGDRGRIGEDAGVLEVHVLHPVDADAHHQREVRDEGEDRIGADVGEDVRAERGDAAVGVHRRLHVGDLATPVRGRHHVLDARLDPPEGHATLPREGGHHHVLGIGAELHAEAAAHLGRDDANLILGEAQCRGQPRAERVRRLVRRPYGDAAAGEVGRGEDGPALDRHAREALAHHPLLHHAMRLRKGSVGVARLDGLGMLDVLRGVLEELGRAVGHGGGRVHDRGQRLPVDGHRGGAVGRSLGGGTDDGGDRLAGMAHAVHREGIVLPPDLALRVAAALGGDARDGQRRDVRHEIAPGHDGDHAGQRARRGGVDAANVRVGVGAAHEGDVQEAGQRDVRDVLRCACDQARVFLALDLSSQKLGCHGGFVLLGPMIRQNAA